MPAHRVNVSWTGLPGGPYLSTFYVDASLFPSAQDAADKVDEFLNDLEPAYSSMLDARIETDVLLYSSPLTITGGDSVTSAVHGGSSVGDLAALATQGLIRWVTSTRVGNRRVQGHTFVPGVTVNYIDATDGGITGTYGTYLDTAAEGLAGALLIASRTADVFAPVFSSVVPTDFAVLRSRRD